MSNINIVLSVCNDISDKLKVPTSQLKALSCNANRYLCLVTEHWLQDLVQGKLNEHWHEENQLSEWECKQYLSLSSKTLPEGWKQVTIKCIRKSTHLVDSLYDSALYNIRPDLSLTELLAYISKETSRSVWEVCYHKYSGHHSPPDTPSKQQFNDVMRTFLRRFHPYSLEDTRENSDPQAKITLRCNPRLAAIYNITHIYSIYETEAYFYIIEPCIPTSLQDIVGFSPAILNTSHAKSLFVVFQLLHILRTFHERGLSIGDLQLSHIRVDHNLWLHVNIPCGRQIPYLKDIVNRTSDHDEAMSPDYSTITCGDDIYSIPKTKANRYLTSARMILKQCCYAKFTMDHLPTVVNKWLNREFTNFQYLMILNHLAGRRMNDPNNHPVFPWVIHFTAPDDDYRDFTVSKYRSNKGDRQLDITYETFPTTLSDQFEPVTPQIPHHISDVLSDITYYVYKARQTPKELLCKFVRSKWVANEYPSSMERMQEWTPDECIPEFFTDPAIFVSMHDDLPDLCIPSWSQSPDDFIRKHMLALESDYVSERLHHWVDLTFGYKLSGEAAVDAKNVHLQLSDGHCTVSNHGIIQLFQSPHPHRVTTSHLLVLKSPKVLLNQIPPLQRAYSDDTDLSKRSQDEGCESSARYDCRIIKLPLTYDPLATLQHLEAAYPFTHDTCALTSVSEDTCMLTSVSEFSQMKHLLRRNALVYRDLQCFACLILEIFYAPSLRLQSTELSLKQRYLKLRQLYNQDRNQLPRPFRNAIVQLLRFDELVPLNDDNDDSLPLFSYESVSKDGLPPPNPSLLLNIHTDIFPFPACFSSLFECLCTLKIKDLAIEVNQLSEKPTVEKLKITKVLSREKVGVLETFLRKNQTSLSREILDIILPYVEDLFNSYNTAVQAAWHLFSPLAQALGQTESKRIFLPHLTHLLGGEESTPKHMKLFHRSFLLQIIIRFGLATFLKSFSTLLVEAVARYKDFDLCSGVAPHDKAEDLHNTSDEIFSMVSMRASEGDTEQSDDLDGFHDDDMIETGTEAMDAILASDTNDEDVQFDDDFPENISLGDKDQNIEVDCENMSHISAVSDNSLVNIQRERADSGGQASLHSISHVLEVSQAEVIEDQDVSVSDSDHTTPEPSFLTNDRVFDEVDMPSEHRDTLRAVVNNDYSVDDCDGDASEVKQSTSMRKTSVPMTEEQYRNRTEESERISEFKADYLKMHGRGIVRSETDEFHNLYHRQTREKMSNICDVALNSVKWLSHWLGPLLAAKYLSRNLIRMMALCYLGEEQTEVLPDNDAFELKSSKLIYGDKNASKVLESLGVLVIMYGERMVLSQYLPAIVDMIAVAQKRLSVRTEASLIGCLVLLRHAIYYLSDRSLMDVLQDTILGEIMMPLLKLACSRLTSFPSGVNTRSIVCHKLIDVIYIIGLRIGFEMSRKHLTVLMHKFFATFDALYAGVVNTTGNNSPFAKFSSSDSFTIESRLGTLSNNSPSNKMSPRSMGSFRGKNYTLTPNVGEDKDEMTSINVSKECIMDELIAVFCPELAYCSYISFCRVFGSSHIEHDLQYDELIRYLSAQHNSFLAQQQSTDEHNYTSHNPDHTDGARSDGGGDSNEEDGGANVASIGNRIEVQTAANGTVPDLSQISQHYKPSGLLNIHPETLSCSDMEHNKHRHVRGNWLAYWEHELGLSERDNLFNFKQIKLQTFQGHQSSIRAMCAMDGENLFMSASKDKTVRLWSLKNYSDGNGVVKCQWVYQRHKRSVFSVAFMEGYRQVASCDTNIHVWDPFTGNPVRHFDSSRNNPVVSMVVVNQPNTCLLAALSDSTLKLLDVRMGNYGQEYKCTTVPHGMIRTLAVCSDAFWVAVGYSSGTISALDFRMGSLLNTWKGHDGEILQMKAFNKNSFVTSSFDHLKLWSVDEGRELCTFKGPAEPVHCFSFYRNQIVSATTANKIGVHSSVDASATFSSMRLRSDTFKGLLTSMNVLPINRTLLLGSDNGTIKLLC